MDLQISSKQEPGYLLVKLVGTIPDVDEWKKVTERVYEEITKNEATHILLDELEMKMPQGIFHQMELVEHVSEVLPIEVRNLCIAVVVTAEYEDIAQFWATASANRGYRGFRSFSDLTEARLWLKNEQDQRS